MKNKFLKILGLVAGIGLGLVIVFQVILAMNTSAIKSSSPTAVNSATSNSSDKEIIAEALNTDFKSYKFNAKYIKKCGIILVVQSGKLLLL